MIELLFALSFTLHNIEEALWLPNWSNHAKKFHQPVKTNEFLFAVLIITIIGYLLTFLGIVCNYRVCKYIYYGYVGMMVLNSVFPHLIATIILKKYAPGLITGLVLNAPIGLYLIYKSTENYQVVCIIFCVLIMSLAIILSLKYLFLLGKRIIVSKT